MLDLRLIREDPDGVREALARRRAADGALDEVLSLDKRWLELRPQIDELRATQNKASEKIAEAKRGGGDASEAIAEMQKVAARVKELQAEEAEKRQLRDTRLASLPNLPAETAKRRHPCDTPLVSPPFPPAETPPPDDEVLREVGQAGKAGKAALELLG